MACKPYRWTAENLDQAEALIGQVGREEAARRIGVTANALKAAFYDNGRELPGGPSWHKVPAAPESKAPTPWQSYQPRPGWKAPEKAKPALVKKAEAVRHLFLTDAHDPYTSRPAWSCALGIARDWKPHKLIVGGDFMDMESLSRHPKSKPDLSRLSSEYHSANVRLDELQEAAGAEVAYYLEGNHEARAYRFACEFGQLDGILSVPKSLYLEPGDDYHRAGGKLRGMSWVPLSMQPFSVDGIGYLHGVFETKHHAASHAEALGPSKMVRHLVYGHMHGLQSFTSAAGYAAHCGGWLGDDTAAVFRSYVKGKPKPWCHAVLLVEVLGEAVTVIPVPIVNGRALVWGRSIAA